MKNILKSRLFCGQWSEFTLHRKNRWSIQALALLIVLLLIPQPGNTKEKQSNSNRLPPAPDTGSPEEDFSAGGTRDNRPRNSICGVENGRIAYLLGNGNREFTLSAYPTFWFYIPNNTNKIAQIEFVITELETGKKIYERVVQGNKNSGITGIDLPKDKKYALSPEVNYAWSFKADCAETDRESEIALEGWVSRSLADIQLENLENQIAAASETEKHTVYLKHNLLYDALTELAQHRMNNPHSTEIEAAWNQLLDFLGWQDLIDQKSLISPSFVNMHISIKKN